MSKDFQQFEQRKRDHVNLALDEQNQALGQSSFECVRLIHDSLPNLNLKEISISCLQSLVPTSTPFFVAGMTAGHEQAEGINSTLAMMAAERGWVFGVGSQRRELENLLSSTEYTDPSLFNLSQRFPNLKLISNLGLAQVVSAHQSGKISHVIQLAEKMRASLLGVHLNPLQEAVQGEGTPNFKGSMDALAELVRISPIPVLVKETGCGMSELSLKKLKSLGVAAVDVSGLGGTHWGRIEGKRAQEKSITAELGNTFQNWGVPTLQSVLSAKKIFMDASGKATTEIWSSGGVRTGLDAAKLLALGSVRVGFAKPALEAALLGEGALDLWMEKIETELKVAMFCTNSSDLSELNHSKVIHE